MSALAIALSFFLQAQPAAEPQPEAAPPPAAEAPAADAPQEEPWPKGVPHDDYQLVAWCYGVLRGYLDLHDEVMPEVTRIETTFRPPGRKLSDDMKVYADMQKVGTKQLKQFQAALTAAEKASLRPINRVGAAAVAQGRSIWEAGPGVTKARKAQEWMSWALPARCETTAKALEERATLLGASFKVNAEPEPPAAEAAPASEPGKTPTEGAPADAPAPEAPTEPKGG
ncbi:MAG TPA: hypothetical protein VGC92_08095 [Phenylobacterium sp.]|jgi:hypothetical protein